MLSLQVHYIISVLIYSESLEAPWYFDNIGPVLGLWRPFTSPIILSQSYWVCFSIKEGPCQVNSKYQLVLYLTIQDNILCYNTK